MKQGDKQSIHGDQAVTNKAVVINCAAVACATAGSDQE